jgi:hypothetical protein
LKTKIFSSTLKNVLAYYDAGVVDVNSVAVELARGSKVSTAKPSANILKTIAGVAAARFRSCTFYEENFGKNRTNE